MFVMLAASLLGMGSLAVQTAAPLACLPADPEDPAPWEHNHRVLSSFPADRPKPQFLGRFSDDDRRYELHLWRDRSGVFGEWLSPVLDADSPVSRPYEVVFDARRAQ